MFPYFFPLALLGLCLALVPRGTDVPFLVESSPGRAHGQMGTGRALPPFSIFPFPPLGRASDGKPSGLLSAFENIQTAKAGIATLAAAPGPLHC